METSADAPDEFLQPVKSLLSHVHLGALAERGYPNWGDSTMSWRMVREEGKQSESFSRFHLSCTFWEVTKVSVSFSSLA